MQITSSKCRIQDSTLMEYLSHLTERPSLEALVQQIKGFEISLEDLKPYIHFRNKQYQRNLIFENEHVQLLCICWKSGQRSVIHDHANSACVVKTITGIASETTFERNSDGFIKEIETIDYTEDVMGSEDDDIHQISNLQTSGEDLITLHCYSPPLRSMKSYSLDSKQAEAIEPIVNEA